MAALPETVLQFGSGKFLRGFADLFIHQANAEGQAVGRVVVVQTTGDRRAGALNRQGGKYHVLVRGLENGQVVDRVEESASISRALFAAEQWPDVLAVARSPELRYVLSNTAEAGYNLDPADGPASAPPRSFPAKLLQVLRARHEAGQPGLTILPCELFERNGDILRGIVLKLAAEWQLPAGLVDWIEQQNHWRSTLVDRIVTVQPSPVPELTHDELLVTVEPYALWAVEVTDDRGSLFRHKAIVPCPRVEPYFLRKVRILNAAHTALLSQALPRGFRTVREAVLDLEISRWLDGLLFEEIVPVLHGRVDDPEGFARQTLERFRNPFLEHKLADIAVYHEEKVKIRLVPTRAEFQEQFGRVPARLDAAVAFDVGPYRK